MVPQSVKLVSQTRSAAAGFHRVVAMEAAEMFHIRDDSSQLSGSGSCE